MTTRYVILHSATAFKIELFLLTGDPHDQSRFSRRQRVDFEGHPAWLPTAEDVIIQKLRWSRGGKRAKDITDAEEVIRLQKPNLDLNERARLRARASSMLPSGQPLNGFWTRVIAQGHIAYIRHWTAQHQTAELFENLLAKPEFRS